MDIEQRAAGAGDEVVAAVSSYLDDLARRTHDRLGEVAGVAVTMALVGDGPVTAGASTQLVRTVDALQYAIGHGPCLEALAGGGGAYVPDLGHDDRWGDYGPRAASLGVRCCQSVPVRAEDTTRAPGSGDAVVAVAKIYGLEVDGLDPHQRELGREFAAEVAAGIRLVQTLHSTAEELSDRTRAMNHRRTIDLAVGILMERAGCDADAAFALLRRYSQDRNVKVHDVARELVDAAPGAASSRADRSLLQELAADVRGAPGEAPFQRRGAFPAR